MMYTMKDLPRDVMGVIGDHMSAPDRARLRATSRRLRDDIEVRADDADILLGLARRFEDDSRIGRTALWKVVGDEWTRVFKACGVKGRKPASWDVDSTGRVSLQAHSGNVMIYIMRRYPLDFENNAPPWCIGKPWGASVYAGEGLDIERDTKAVRSIMETFGAAFPNDDIVITEVYRTVVDVEERNRFVRTEKDDELYLAVREIVERSVTFRSCNT